MDPSVAASPLAWALATTWSAVSFRLPDRMARTTDETVGAAVFLAATGADVGAKFAFGAGFGFGAGFAAVGGFGACATFRAGVSVGTDFAAGAVAASRAAFFFSSLRTS
jgi:hypothetical protein